MMPVDIHSFMAGSLSVNWLFGNRFCMIMKSCMLIKHQVLVTLYFISSELARNYFKIKSLLVIRALRPKSVRYHLTLIYKQQRRRHVRRLPKIDKL